MTKFNLLASVTSKIFKTSDEVKNFEKVLEAIAPDELSIFRDPEKLEEIFLIQNINKLKNKQFRIKLLEGSFGTKRFYNFLSKINTPSISMNATESQKQKFINSIASFEWKNNKQTLAFVEAFELEGAIPTTIIEKDLEILQKPEFLYFPLFEYQFEVFNETKLKIALPSSRQIIRVPTGGGKTKIAMEIVADFFNNNENVTIVWLAETEELLNQATNEFKKIWRHRGNKHIYLNRAWGTKNRVKPDVGESKLIVAGLKKLINYLKDERFKADLIIFDEAHHAAATEYSKVIRILTKSSTKILGLTATPGRGKEDETQKLAELFFNNPPIQINTHDPYLTPIKFLQKKGVLSKLIFKTPIKIPEIKEKFSKQEINKLLKSSEYDDKKILMKIGQDHIRNIRIAKKLLELDKENKQVLYFGPTVEQSKLMYVLLTNFGIKAAVIDKDTSKEFRAEIISKFQKKEIHFLLNFNVFVAGFDAPAVDTVFIGRPTKSPNTLLQMIGRGMRGPNVESGTETCDIYYVEDKFLSRFQNFDELYRTYDEYYEREESINEENTEFDENEEYNEDEEVNDEI